MELTNNQTAAFKIAQVPPTRELTAADLTADQFAIFDRIARAGTAYINTDLSISLGKAIGQLVAAKLAAIEWVTYYADGDPIRPVYTLGKVAMTRAGVAVWWPKTHGLDRNGTPTHLFYGIPGEKCETCGEPHPLRFPDYAALPQLSA